MRFFATLTILWISNLGLDPVVARLIYVPKPVDTGNHSIYWTPSIGDGQRELFEEKIQETTKTNDFFVVFTGDTQYWYPCTPENYECHRQAAFCATSNSTCKQRHGDIANRMQKQSITALIRTLRHIQHTPKAVIINGDLTDFGHPHEKEEYTKYWPGNVDQVRIYPGLGNHDYANNVNECAMNHCANRMLTFLFDYVRTHLRLHMHVGIRTEGMLWRKYTGSLAYSWDQCADDNSNCVHFVQLHNYPTYQTKFEFPLNEWTIRESVGWLQADLKQTQHPVVINFHDFDTAFTTEDKVRVQNALRQSGKTILGIFFAHFHSNVGLHHEGRWCINGRPVPLIYSGSVPANNYVLVQFRDSDLERITAFHVNSDNQTTAWPVPLFNAC